MFLFVCYPHRFMLGKTPANTDLVIRTVRLGLSAPPAHRSRLRKTRRLPPVDSPHRPDHDLDSKLIFIG
jgi:hypothetical protein